jgi:hypothetical protein
MKMLNNEHIKAIDVSIAEMVSFISKACRLSLYCEDVESTDCAAGFWRENV